MSLLQAFEQFLQNWNGGLDVQSEVSLEYPEIPFLFRMLRVPFDDPADREISISTAHLPQRSDAVHSDMQFLVSGSIQAFPAGDQGLRKKRTRGPPKS